MKITTSFDYPPIPIRSMDWSAIDADTYDGAPDAGHQCVGHGASEQEAITDLLNQLVEQRLSELQKLGALVPAAPLRADRDSYQTAEIFHPKFQIEVGDTKAKLSVVGLVR